MVVVENANDDIIPASFCKLHVHDQYVVYHEKQFNRYTCSKPGQRHHSIDVIEPFFGGAENQRTKLSNGTVVQFVGLNFANFVGGTSTQTAGDYVLAARGIKENSKRLTGETQIFSFPDGSYIRYIGKAKVGANTFVWEPLGDLKTLLEKEVRGFSKVPLVDQPPVMADTSCKANPVDFGEPSFGQPGWGWPGSWGNVQSVTCTLKK